LLEALAALLHGAICSNELSDGLLALFDLALQQTPVRSRLTPQQQRIAVVHAAIGFGSQ
jgi:hypothetical protein